MQYIFGGQFDPNPIIPSNIRILYMGKETASTLQSQTTSKS